MKLLKGRISRNVKDEGQFIRSNATADDYQDLLDYYDDIFDLFDCVFCNSPLAQSIYQKHYAAARYVQVPLTRSGLTVMGKEARNNRVIRMGYFGGEKDYKGFGVLRDAITYFDDLSLPWELHLYGDDHFQLEDANIIAHGKYDSRCAQSIMSELDVVIVPSIWFETFGFIVLEALCSGASVVCSSSVGASFLVPPSCVFESGKPEGVVRAIEAALAEGSQTDRLDGYPLDIVDHAVCLLARYEEVSGVLAA